MADVGMDELAVYTAPYPSTGRPVVEKSNETVGLAPVTGRNRPLCGEPLLRASRNIFPAINFTHRKRLPPSPPLDSNGK